MNVMKIEYHFPTNDPLWTLMLRYFKQRDLMSKSFFEYACIPGVSVVRFEGKLFEYDHLPHINIGDLRIEFHYVSGSMWHFSGGSINVLKNQLIDPLIWPMFKTVPLKEFLEVALDDLVYRSPIPIKK